MMFFLQLDYEFQQIYRWAHHEQICGSPFVRNLVVGKNQVVVMANVFYKPPAQNVMELTPVSYALANNQYN